MFLLRIQPVQIGDPPKDVLEQVTFSVDPAGTHLETYYPRRFFYGGVNDWTVRDVAHFPIRQLVNEAAVVEAQDLERALRREDMELRARHLRPTEGLLLRTGTSNRWRNPALQPREVISTIYSGQETGFSMDAAKWISEHEVGVCGFDCRSPEDPSDHWNLRVHQELLTHNVLLCEDMANLDHLTEERVLLLASTPLKGQHLTGVLARMVALEARGDEGYRPIDLSHLVGCYPEPGPSPLPRVELEEDHEEVIRRMDVLFFDMSEYGIGDSTGPQYVRFTTHTGTHLVNPRQRQDGRLTPLFADVTLIPLDRLIAPGCIVDLSHVGPRQVITANEIRKHGSAIQAGDWVFIRTDHMDWYREHPGLYRNSPILSVGAVAEIAGRGAIGLVSDLAQMVPLAGRWEINSALHEHNLLAVEGAWHLWLIRKPRFLAAVLPLPIAGLVGSPAHVFAIETWG